MEIKGIDVSSWQGKPDWAKVSNSGTKFAILRIHQKSGIDESFEHNYKGCKSNGILIGGYMVYIPYDFLCLSGQICRLRNDTCHIPCDQDISLPVRIRP